MAGPKTRRSGLTEYGYAGAPGIPQEGWLNFFSRVDFNLAARDPDWSGHRVTMVEYADRECFASHPNMDSPKWSFLNFPEQPLPSARRAGRQSGACRRTHNEIISEIGQNDVIMGTGKIWKALVDAARQKSSGTDLFVLNHPCTPVVIGDDLENLAQQCRDATGRPVISLTRQYKAGNGETGLGMLVRMVRGESGFLKVPPDPKGVNLFGFPKNYRDEELVPILEEMGLRVNAVLLPELNLASARRIMNAGLNVFLEGVGEDPAVRKLLQDNARQVLVVPAPYGISGSYDCELRIALAAGMGLRYQRSWRKRSEAFRKPWLEMKDEAQRYRLGFVINQSNRRRLFDLHPLRVPIMRLLFEMGFGVDILLYAPEALNIRSRRIVAAAAEAKADVSIHTFGNERELARCLRAAECKAVYSDFFFDRRLSAAGKAQFSLRHFKMGVGGALRSLEGLLQACRLPFYRRYFGYLDDRQRRPYA
jgi:hypothetical protein